MAILRVGLKVLNPPEDADKVLTGGLSFLASALFSWTARAKAASLTTSTLRKAAASRTHLARPCWTSSSPYSFSFCCSRA